MMLKGALVAGATDRGSLNSYLHSIKGFSGSMGHYDLSPEDYFTLPARPPQTPYLTVKAESLLAKSASSGLFVPRDSGSITCLYIIVVFRSL